MIRRRMPKGHCNTDTHDNNNNIGQYIWYIDNNNNCDDSDTDILQS